MKKTNSSTGRYIVAVKDLDNTLKGLRDKSIVLQGTDEKLVLEMLNSPLNKVNNLGGLGRFIRKVHRKDVKLYWESLIANDYTLMEVKYDSGESALKGMCDNNIIKYLGEQTE